MSTATVFVVVFAVFITGHQVGDYWVQRESQAFGKSLPGWTGHRYCFEHVFTYTLTLAALLALAKLTLGLSLGGFWVLAGLLVSAVTHYVADRRRPLRWIAVKLGKSELWNLGTGPASGAAYLDQSWHWAWLFVSALIVAGGAR